MDSAAVAGADSVGLGWRPELAASIYAHLDEIDVIEVVAENYFRAPRRERDALRWLAAQVPVYLHGVSMGLASTHPVETAHVDAMARLVEAICPAGWSEHLAFVRVPGIEIGHMAPPPRNDATIEATAGNLRVAQRIVGSSPLLENIATLVEPPGSQYDEAHWVTLATAACDSMLLLDLHNLYANAINCGRDPATDLQNYPLARVAMVHLSGGVMVRHESGAERLLDDHLHDVPPAVIELLALVAQRASRPLNVIIERDGHFPPFGELRRQLRAARAALRAGRLSHPGPELNLASGHSMQRMCDAPNHVQTQTIERVFAGLLSDRTALQEFLVRTTADSMAGFDPQAVDRVGLALAAQSYAHKRATRRRSYVDRLLWR